MADETNHCTLDNLLCGVTATAYVDKYGNPYPTDEPGDIWLDKNLAEPYWCGICGKGFKDRAVALAHVGITLEVAA